VSEIGKEAVVNGTDPAEISPSTAKAQRSVSVIRSEEEFRTLERDWKHLFLQGRRPVPFLAWEWVTTWWKHFGKRAALFVVVVKDGAANVLGIAPLQIATRKAMGLVPVRSLEFIGYRGSSVSPDHVDFLVNESDPASILKDLVRAIFENRGEWDRVVLADLAEDSQVPGTLFDFARVENLTAAELVAETCPWVALPASWDALLKAAKEKRRSLIKWRRKKLLQAYKVDFERLENLQSVQSAIDTLAQLHTLSRKRKGERGNFFRPDYLAFHHEVAAAMADAGYLYFAQIVCDGHPAACSYGFHVGSVLYDYQKGFDPAFSRDGAGSVLTGMVIEDAIERLHASEIDFLRGSEEYKYFWTSQDRKTKTAFVWAKTSGGGISEREFTLRRRIAPRRRRAAEFKEKVLARRNKNKDKQQPPTSKADLK